MDPHRQFCPNPACPAHGRVGQGNIGVHSRKTRRYRCATCRKSFAATAGTPFYRLQTAAETVTLVLTLLCHGCPLQAIVAAFGLDERTVAAWQARAGGHCQALQAHLVERGELDLGHVQADELWVKVVGGRVWQAMAMLVPSRLWLGGVVSRHRDGALITALVQRVRACAGAPVGLVCVDGLASYVTAFTRVFRTPVYTGRRGRPRLVLDAGLLIGQVIKRYARRRVIDVTRRIVRGTPEAVAAALAASGSSVLNTADIERLNATFRGALAPLVRRGRAIVRTEAALTAGMYLVGCAYNLCWEHASLRLPAPAGTGRAWLPQTPAMAAGLTDHRWSMHELLSHRIPVAEPRVAAGAPRRRGRPPKQPARTPLPLAA